MGRQTTLRRRMMLQLGLMVACSLLVGLGAVLGINGLHQDMSEAVRGYRELRQIYDVGFQAARARDARRPPCRDASKSRSPTHSPDDRVTANPARGGAVRLVGHVELALSSGQRLSSSARKMGIASEILL